MPHAATKVLLVHGLGRSGRSFALAGQVLRRAGFQPSAISYPSTTVTLPRAIDCLETALSEAGPTPLHLVTHSLGGILVRALLARQDVPQVQRVVMLAPPNQGSGVVDVLGHWTLFRSLTGPIGPQLGTGRDALPARLPTVDFPLGVIAGSLAINPIFAALLKGSNDGTVSVENTKVAGMTDHITLPTSHSLLMNHPMVLAQVITFLRHGRFDHGLRPAHVGRRLLSRVRRR